ncbi:heparanase-like [Haliotis rubra]|uniref:heparanase-like n=1 Tax=Haliotis rubra TaxID=36100 RepID=UPI001EE63540|nr:heparanase-like [Haliotis rubra]
MTMDMFLCLFGLAWIQPFTVSLHTEHIRVKTNHVLHVIDDMFVGVNIDSGRLRYNLKFHNVSSPKLQALGKALAPGYLRVGGTSGDYMVFDPTHDIATGQQFQLRATTWDDLNMFVQRLDSNCFLTDGGASAIDVLTVHHYYFNGNTAKLEDFSYHSIMDRLISEVQTVVGMVRSYHGLVAWLGETSSGYGGGTPGIGNRYVAGNL